MTERRSIGLAPTAVVFGYGGFGEAGLAAVARAGFHVARVFTHADAPGEYCWWRSMAARAEADGIPVVRDADLRDAGVQARVAADAPAFLFSFFYRHLIPNRVLGLAARGAYNFHSSLLPRFRGRAPLNWQLVHGAAAAGLTLHRMAISADAGGIVAQERVAIGPDDDARAVFDRLLARLHPFLDDALAALRDGRAVETAQAHADATIFPGRRPDDGRIRWEQPARRIHDLVRALAPPWPGAFAVHAGTRLAIHRTRVIAADGVAAEPGTVLPGNRVACGLGVVEVLTAIPALPTPGNRLS
jgi:UDP-4-amino-4-deoxy-L-arabinose formyltransferase/UDP-glucuronic acid dehydrogenase (UDP-4-keto-hexauronic acid decarboxylating)